MKWFGKDAEGQARVLGIPVSGLWLGRSDAALDGFEPENPRLFIPRKYGLGWDINLGAVGVKLGLIRPDDSLPDLAQYVPASLKRGVRLVTIAGGVSVVACALALSRKSQVPVRWSTTEASQKFASGKLLALPPVVLTGVATLAPRVLRRDEPESGEAARLASQADLLGVEAMSLAWLIAMCRATDKSPISRWLTGACVILWPLVSGGTGLAYVKTALGQLEAKLHESKENR
ncbi:MULTISPECIES: DUF5808 domain-containing protein [Actinotignum]|uniref:DUF5808 domain-containing protein n=1 Tax=Actinotignum urinale TaxID=190146 RepID=A0ABU5G9R0_9ACTO|nr:DUF5808 domain-containing protein [Actinotignum urinale]MDY5133452.1 DUF5808 domain-containing protein [Actinotignum urinale]PLB80798.1 hypothetical protein CYJ21_00945 [Actinomyces sp. UMB0138]